MHAARQCALASQAVLTRQCSHSAVSVLQVLVESLQPQMLRLLGVDLVQHRVLPVAMVDVNAYLAELTTELPGLISLAEKGPCIEHVVCVHLGVCTDTTFRLESCAYNEASFRVPDVRGEQPQGQVIEADMALGAACQSDLDLAAVCQALKDLGYDTRVSTDPGRYICNYIYFQSLAMHRVEAKCAGPVVQSVFVHVPTFERIPESQQRAFLPALLVVLNRSLQTATVTYS